MQVILTFQSLRSQSIQPLSGRIHKNCYSSSLETQVTLVTPSSSPIASVSTLLLDRMLSSQCEYNLGWHTCTFSCWIARLIGVSRSPHTNTVWLGAVGHHFFRLPSASPGSTQLFNVACTRKTGAGERPSACISHADADIRVACGLSGA